MRTVCSRCRAEIFATFDRKHTLSAYLGYTQGLAALKQIYPARKDGRFGLWTYCGGSCPPRRPSPKGKKFFWPDLPPPRVLSNPTGTLKIISKQPNQTHSLSALHLP